LIFLLYFINIAFPSSPAAIYYYPTLIGDTKDPTMGGGNAARLL
jgi:hypothetical protein